MSSGSSLDPPLAFKERNLLQRPTRSPGDAAEDGTLATPQRVMIIVTAQRRQDGYERPISFRWLKVESSREAFDARDLSNRLPNVVSHRVPAPSSCTSAAQIGRHAGSSIGRHLHRRRYRGDARHRWRCSTSPVEILKGPQTTFFGPCHRRRLNIITRKPGNTFEGNASALWAPNGWEYAFRPRFPSAHDTLSPGSPAVDRMDGYIVSTAAPQGPSR